MPYAHRIHVSYFDDAFCDRMDRFATNLLEDHLRKGGVLPEYVGTSYTNILFYAGAIENVPEISFILEDCNLRIIPPPTMGFVPPDKEMGVHTDEYGCVAKILLPIWPIDNSHPLNFYDRVDGDPIFSIKTEPRCPIVFDCDKLHGGVRTYGDWRTNLQFKFGDPYDLVVQMIRDNTLFKTIETSILD